MHKFIYLHFINYSLQSTFLLIVIKTKYSKSVKKTRKAILPYKHYIFTILGISVFIYLFTFR